MRRTALIASYHYPPYGGAGVQRTLALARYLPRHGYTPIVLTGPGDAAEYWTPLDASLGAGEEVTVVRVPSPEPRPSRLRRRAERLFGLPSSLGQWFSEGAERAAAALEQDIDIVLAELGPYETVEGARRAARTLKVPWVADLQDPWALDEMWLYPSAAHRLLDRRRMRRALGDAAAVVMNAGEAARRVREQFGHAPRTLATISNGFFAEDFAAPVPARRSERFVIVHSGSLHTQMGLEHRRVRRRREFLGGMPVPGVDYLGRSHVFLIQALDALLRERPELASRLEVDLIGQLTEDDRAVVGDRAWVRTDGFLPHDETLVRVRTADLLFLPMHDMPAGTRAGLVPAKTYEYVASGRPILAAVPAGDARDLLQRLEGVDLVSPKDVDGMRRVVAARLDRWLDEGRTGNADRPELTDVTFEMIVGRVADVLDSVLSR